MIVLDASAVVSILLNLGPDAEPIWERIGSPGENVHVPHLLDVEVLHVLRRQTLRGTLARGRAATILQDLENIKMTRYPHAPFLRLIWDLRQNVTTYDAAYVALAEALDAPLVTMDERLARAPGNHAKVELYR